MSKRKKNQNTRRIKKPKTPAAGKKTASHKTQSSFGISGSLTKPRLITYLETASILYLALPLSLFLLGFFHWGVGICATVSLGAAIWFYSKRMNDSPPAANSGLIPEAPPISYAHILLCLLAAVIVTGLFGAGGWGSQAPDWWKHNAILAYLTLLDWPVEITTDKEYGGENKFLLVYYVGYYMTAAFIGKALGFFAANQVLFVYTAVGIFLSLLWIFIFSRTTAKWIIPAFFLFSGMDVFNIFTLGNLDDFNFSSHIEQSGRPEHNKQFSSVLTGIAWLPQHVIPAWILTGLMLKSIACGRLFQSGVFFTALGLLWSVFTALGLVAFVIVYFLITKDKKKSFLSSFSPENIGALLPLLCLCIYFLASSSAATGMDFKLKFSGHYLSFLFAEFLALWVVLYAAHRYLANRSEVLFKDDFKRVFFVSLILILIFFGFTHDFQKNASHTSVFILFLATIRMLESANHIKIYNGFRNLAYSVIVILLIGAVTPAVELNRALNDIHKKGAIYSAIKPYGLHSSFANVKKYIGSPGSMFYNLRKQ